MYNIIPINISLQMMDSSDVNLKFEGIYLPRIITKYEWLEVNINVKVVI